MTIRAPSVPAGVLDDVSRETKGRLEAYEAALRKWSARINLVSARDIDDLSTRHIVDSAQLWALAPKNAKTWVDIGSGGGLPGMVIAILATEKNPDLRVTFVESDQRKAAFLSTTSRDLNLSARTISARIENLRPLKADVISARALAPLRKLIDYAHPHLVTGGLCLFPKGISHADEIAEARSDWHFSCEVIPSATLAGAAILKIAKPSRLTPHTERMTR